MVVLFKLSSLGKNYGSVYLKDAIDSMSRALSILGVGASGLLPIFRDSEYEGLALLRRRCVVVCFASLQVLEIVNSNSEGSGASNPNVVEQKEASSSWIQEEGKFVSRKSKSLQVI